MHLSPLLPYSNRVSIAPMMEYTDRHCRYFLRLITRHALLYTEMVTTEAILQGNPDKLLSYDPLEHPLALQLGGSDPEKLARCAHIALAYGYDELNLNAGCPSNRVQQGKFGACLIKEPILVAECLDAMQVSTDMPVTLKTRIGVDSLDQYAHLYKFIETVSTASHCRVFIIHARKAWLKGVSPKENRTLPPLRYDMVLQLKKDFPHLTIILNGGIQTISHIQTLLEQTQGVMIGRKAYQDPYFLADIDRLFYGSGATTPSRFMVIQQLLPYIEQHLKSGLSLTQISRHLLGLFHGLTGAKQWRRHLSCYARQPKANSEVLTNAMQLLTEIPESLAFIP